MSDPAVKQDDTLLGNLGAGTVAALNSAALGAPEFIARLAGQGKAYDDYMAQHQNAKNIGDIAGTVGSIFIPGGAILKGASAGAKLLGAGKTGAKLADLGLQAAGKAGNLGHVSRGALVAAEQAVPRALIGTGNQVAQGDDPLKAARENALEAGLGTAAGGLVGGALGKGVDLARKALGDPVAIAAANAAGKPAPYGTMLPQDVGRSLEENSARMANNGLLGINTRVARWLANLGGNYQMGGAGQAKAIDRASQDLADYMGRTGVRNIEDVTARHEQIKEGYDAISKGIDSSNTFFPTKIRGEGGLVGKTGELNLPEWMSKDPEIVSWINKIGPQRAQSAMTSYMSKISGELDNLAQSKGIDPIKDNLRNMLARDAQGLRFNQDPDLQNELYFAGLTKDALDNHAMNLVKSGKVKVPEVNGQSLDLDKMAKDYRDLRLFRLAQRAHATDFTSPVGTNSNTQLKTAFQNALAPGAGIALGGTIGASSNQDNPILGAIGGAAIGGLASKGIDTAANKYLSSKALQLNQALAGHPIEAKGVINNLLNKATPEGVEGTRDFLVGRRGGLNVAALPEAAMLQPGQNQIAQNAGPTPAPQMQQPMPQAAPGSAPPAQMHGVGMSNAQGVQTKFAPQPQGQQSAPQASAPNQQQPQQGQQPVQQAPQAPPEGAGIQFLQSQGVYGQQLLGKLGQLYDTINRSSGQMDAQGVSFGEFVNRAGATSNGFDPAITANLMYPDESQRKAFLESYQQVKMLKGIDTAGLLKTNPILGVGAPMINPGYQIARQQLSNVMSQTGKPTDVANALKQLDQLQWLNTDGLTKQKLLAQILQKQLNINVAQVHQLGLDKGTVLEALYQ